MNGPTHATKESKLLLCCQHHRCNLESSSPENISRKPISIPKCYQMINLVTFVLFCYYHHQSNNVRVEAFVASYTKSPKNKYSIINQNKLTSTASFQSTIGRLNANSNFGEEESMYEIDDDFLEGVIPFDDGDEEDEILTAEIIQSLTVPQLKQQLRLRGLKVTGKKQDLIDRLQQFGSRKSFKNNNKKKESNVVDTEVLKNNDSRSKTKAEKFAEKHGKEFIDVSAYVEKDDNQQKNNMFDNEETEETTEVWGEEAKKVRITSDLNDDNPVVDNLSRTVIEYSGYRKVKINAFVVASRDALKGYLTGGATQQTSPESDKSSSFTGNNDKNKQQQASMEKMHDIQVQREKAARVPVPRQQSDVEEGIVEPDEQNTAYDHVIERDYTDWGKYTNTGAQISATEVQGVLFLSDVRGPFSKDAKALCEKIAFECQPCVVMAPDLFRGRPWEEIDGSGYNKEAQDYEEWRAQHFDERVNVDIRASASILRNRYAVSSIAVFGTCFGGGRALEVAAGWIPQNSKNGATDPDVDILTGPRLVEPAACIAWYPTRYNAGDLFGKSKRVANIGTSSEVAIMGIFADQDTIPGATKNDASILKELLESDERVKDNMIKVFSGQDHGFAHVGLGDRDGDGVVGGGDGEVAALLSTAFLETYTRMFLPTVGVPVKHDDGVGDWTSIEMQEGIGKVTRDIRAEIAAAEEAYDDLFDDFDFDYTDVGTKFW